MSITFPIEFYHSISCSLSTYCFLLIGFSILFKDNHNCSHLIAEALDPDGKISSTQISNKLKQLGLKVARRRRLRHAQESVSAEPSQNDGDGEVEETVITHHESKTRPLHTRKRVRGLSEEQEAQIRSLYGLKTIKVATT